MADTLDNIKLTGGVWTDFYAESGLSRGSTVTIQNIGVTDLYYTVLDTEPAKDYDAYKIFRRNDKIYFQDREPFIWLFSPNVDGKINGDIRSDPVPVVSVNQTTQALDLIFLKDIDQATLDGATTVNSRFFNVALGDGAKFTADDIAEIGSASTFIQARVLGIVADTVEIDTPLNTAYADGSTVFIKDENLRVDGSTTPVIFEISPETNQFGEITRILLLMEATVDMDSGTFGPLAALTNGVVIRKKLESGDFNNLINFKTNSEFIEHCFDFSFLPNNGNGIRMFVSRLSYAGMEKFGVAIILNGSLGEELQVVIQDDLTGATFTNFKLIAQGHEE